MVRKSAGLKKLVLAGIRSAIAFRKRRLPQPFLPLVVRFTSQDSENGADPEFRFRLSVPSLEGRQVKTVNEHGEPNVGCLLSPRPRH
jgi:hypothetical protein